MSGLDINEITDGINTITAEYREHAYDTLRLKDMRADLSVLVTQLGDYAGDVLKDSIMAEYERKSAEAEQYSLLRKTHGATDSDRMVVTKVRAEYEHEALYKGMYKKLENQRQGIMQILHSMASKLKENAEQA